MTGSRMPSASMIGRALTQERAVPYGQRDTRIGKRPQQVCRLGGKLAPLVEERAIEVCDVQRIASHGQLFPSSVALPSPLIGIDSPPYTGPGRRISASRKSLQRAAASRIW